MNGNKIGAADESSQWPNFFIVGAARAGTTSLYEYLKQASGVYLSEIKEPRFFIADSETRDFYGRNAIGKREEYLRLFKKADSTVIGEATPEYLYRTQVADAIHKVSPHAKIIISLRNPIYRGFTCSCRSLRW
jgi:hypothetical protein